MVAPGACCATHRYHRNLNADAGACVEALSGYRADVVQLVFMHRVMRGDLKSKSQAGAGGASTASSHAGSASTTSTRKRGSHLGAGMDAESTPGADESFPPELEAALAKVEQAEATATKLRSTPDGDEERWALAESLKVRSAVPPLQVTPPHAHSASLVPPCARADPSQGCGGGGGTCRQRDSWRGSHASDAEAGDVPQACGGHAAAEQG